MPAESLSDDGDTDASGSGTPRYSASAPETVDATKPRLYRVIWRWHFYAGLIVSPILLVAAITGALYVFHAELAGWIYEDLYFVKPASERLSYDNQRTIAQQAAGGKGIEFLTVHVDPRRSTEFIADAYEGGDANPDQTHRSVFVNPYTGEVLGTQIQDKEFFHIILELHRTLFAGAPGRVIVELATSWGLVLLVTGIFLWWPRNKSRVYGVWLPRLKGKPYLVLRDLHAVVGMYATPIAAIILVTGLFMSQVWGTGYTWISVQTKQSLGDFLARGESKGVSERPSPDSLDRSVAGVLGHSQPDDVMYFMPATTPKEAHKAYLMNQGDVNTVRGFDVDQYTGAIVTATDTAELKPMVRILAFAESLHQGLTFGMTSKILAFLTCLALIGMVITGVWMWWKRRPKGETGFPHRPKQGAVPKWVGGLTVLLGILLPTVGASIILILSGDWLVRRFVGDNQKSLVQG
ncbi:PepSY domain-containing protein [Singulisphaera sp. Ch08]|uniref:PepSY domain-containing protein n=1 Tax=Singulisphaera sp. Ch08 TaxID=3120278 RepID=A0AAU7C8N8_9BACT